MSSHPSNHPVRFVFLCLLVFLQVGRCYAAENPKVYRFGTGTAVHGLLPLSDGSVLGVGWTKNLDWVPAATLRIQLSAGTIRSHDTTGRAILVRWNPGLDSIRWVAVFPPGTVGPLRRVRASGATVYLSGDRTVSDPLDDGYFIARLGGDPTVQTPSVSWTFNAVCPPRRAGGRRGTSQYKTVQAWDVDSKPMLWLAQGSEADYDSAEVLRLDGASGSRTVVAEWDVHVSSKGTIWRGSPSTYPSSVLDGDTLLYSRLVLNSLSDQAPRTREKYLVKANGTSRLDTGAQLQWSLDSSGGLRWGRQPLDILFSGPCREYFSKASNRIADSVRCATGRGPTGLTASSRATPRIGGIVVERDRNRWVLGVTWSALSADGSPVDVPALLVFESEGKPLWWSRLRSDATLDTVIPSRVPDLAEIGSLTLGGDEGVTGPAVLVSAQARNGEAFWSPRLSLKQSGWRNDLSGLPLEGAEGTWLGSLAFVNGRFLAATWQSAPSAKSGGDVLPDPFYAGWPRPGSPGEILSSTRCPVLGTGGAGAPVTMCQGERPMTTSGTPVPVPPPGASGAQGWQVLTRWMGDLSGPLWAMAIDGPRVEGDSGPAVDIHDLFVLQDGAVLLVGDIVRGAQDFPFLQSASWTSSSGTSFIGLLPAPLRVGTNPRTLRESSLRWSRERGGVRVVVPGSGEVRVRWIDARGRWGEAFVPAREGIDQFRIPLADPGARVAWLEVRRGGSRWVVPIPLLH
ncbi:MAG: hypothetical protein H6686_08845 [Fibrobacteria bacterium]|nr:hypothetical protein [Fibrobacteria bacterium]